MKNVIVIAAGHIGPVNTEELAATRNYEAIHLSGRATREYHQGCASSGSHWRAVRYYQGHLTVLNRRELEKLAGESYAAVAKEYRHLQEYSVFTTHPFRTGLMARRSIPTQELKA